VLHEVRWELGGPHGSGKAGASLHPASAVSLKLAG